MFSNNTQRVMISTPAQPIANLPVTIFKFAMSPFAEWQQLAWAGVLIITLCVLLLNILARQNVQQQYAKGDDQHPGPGQLLPFREWAHRKFKDRHRQVGDRLGRGADHHPLRIVAEHSGARHFREEETRLNFYGAAARGAE